MTARGGVLFCCGATVDVDTFRTLQESLQGGLLPCPLCRKPLPPFTLHPSASLLDVVERYGREFGCHPDLVAESRDPNTSSDKHLALLRAHVSTPEGDAALRRHLNEKTEERDQLREQLADAERQLSALRSACIPFHPNLCPCKLPRPLSPALF